MIYIWNGVGVSSRIYLVGSWVRVGEYSGGGGGFWSWGRAVRGTIEFPSPWATPSSRKGLKSGYRYKYEKIIGSSEIKMYVIVML